MSGLHPLVSPSPSPSPGVTFPVRSHSLDAVSPSASPTAAATSGPSDRKQLTQPHEQPDSLRMLAYYAPAAAENMVKNVESAADDAGKAAASAVHSVVDGAEKFGQDFVSSAPEFGRSGALTVAKIAFKPVPAGDAGEDAADAAWRQHSASTADGTQWQKATSASNPDLANASFGILSKAGDSRTHSNMESVASKPVGATLANAHPPMIAARQKRGTGTSDPASAIYARFITSTGTLANADKATGVIEKLSQYSLNDQHTTGAHKARVFTSALGYDHNNAQSLSAQIKAGIMHEPATLGAIDEHGVRFTVDVPVTGPAGSATVRTGWIYRTGEDAPRMTTGFVK